MIKEFKAFIMKGNVLDLAVALIIGAAFGKIISSLVNDVIMPPIGYLLGGVNFKDFMITLQPEVLDAAGEVVQPLVAIKYGAWGNTIIEFLIVAFCVFMIVKAYNKTKKPAPEPEPEKAPEPSNEEKLLMEIRDALKNK